MSIDRVTITGADDSIRPEDLLPLTKDFPFVEWGILASENNTMRAGGTTRYPSPKWITDLQGIVWSTGALPQLALHINGRWVRELLMGNLIVPHSLFDCFGRVQLNFHAERSSCVPEQFAKCLRMLRKDFIFQLDGANGNKHLDAANAEEVPRCFGLFDVSGGAGILPREWPKPIYLEMQPGEDGCGEQYHDYHGYAGGLGPDNLAEQIPRILEAAAATEFTHEGRIWIDMETRVRSDNDRQFDLEKVRRCLEISAPFVKQSVPA
jgi:hypothetical protein